MSYLTQLTKLTEDRVAKLTEQDLAVTDIESRTNGWAAEVKLYYQHTDTLESGCLEYNFKYDVDEWIELP